MRIGTTLALAAAAIVAAAPARALQFGFDADAEGWTAANGGTLSHVAAGGNPGGYLRIDDASNEDFVVVAPTSLNGDRSSFLGGSIAFDAVNLNNDAPDYGGFGLVTLSGAGFVLTADPIGVGAPLADAQWHRYAVPLTVALWGPNLPAVLAALDGLRIEPEFHVGVSESVGVDNIAITAVPEPAPAALLAAGAAALALIRRRRAPSSSSSSPPPRSGGCAPR